MKNKGYFGSNQKTEKNAPTKTSVFVIILIAIFVPAILAIVFYSLNIGNNKPSDEQLTQVALYDESTLLFEERSSSLSHTTEGLVYIFTSIQEKLSPKDAIPDSSKEIKPLRAVITTPEATSEYTCYFSKDKGMSFCEDKESKVYQIDDDLAFIFMSSKYAQRLYSEATPPKLYSTSNDEIIPSSVSWKYRAVNEKLIEATDVKIEENQLLYDMAGALGLNFEVPPDSCTVDIKKSGTPAYSLKTYDLSSIKEKPGTTLQFSVVATWNESDDASFCGTVSYNFQALLRDSSEFILNKTSLSTGDFILVSATNVIDTSKIQFSSSPSINYTPVFFKDGDLVRALIPFSSELEAGTYSLSFTHGAAAETIDVTLTAHPNNDTVLLDSSSDVIFKQYANSTTTNETNAIVASVESSYSQYIFFRTPFLDYTQELGASLTYKYGTAFYDSTETIEHVLDGNLYTFSDDTSTTVTALNSGTVVKCGSSTYLGNFAIVEHGMGLRTVYARLGKLDVKQGDNLLKGQAVGKSGVIDSNETQGVLIMCYVFGTAVDYELLSGNIPKMYYPPVKTDK